MFKFNQNPPRPASDTSAAGLSVPDGSSSSSSSNKAGGEGEVVSFTISRKAAIGGLATMVATIAAVVIAINSHVHVKQMSDRMSHMHMELVTARSLQETPPDELAYLLEESDIVEAAFLSKFKDLLRGPPGKSHITIYVQTIHQYTDYHLILIQNLSLSYSYQIL